MKTSLHEEFIHQSIFRLEDNTERIKRCFEELSEMEIWQKPNASSNSVGNLVLHVCGNISHFIGACLGRNGYVRDRRSEFSDQKIADKVQLIAKLENAIHEAEQILKSLPAEDLLKQQIGHNLPESGLGMVVHVVQHMAYHTGQIMFWTKVLRDKDMAYQSQAPKSHL